MEYISQFISIPDSAHTILLLTLILGVGFLMTRVTKLFKMPHVTGYLLAGILIGPSVLKWVDVETVQRLDFVTDIALAIIAFSVGKFFKISELKSNGVKAVVLTIAEASGALIIVTLSMHYLFGLPWPFCVLLGEIGRASCRERV